MSEYIKFELWLDEKNHWSEHPTHKRKAMLPAIRIECMVCESSGHIIVDEVHFPCNHCHGNGFILTPDREKAGEAIVECYFRQLEIVDFNQRAEIEEERFSCFWVDERTP